MMILRFDAIVANAAVMTPRRAPDVAGFAEFGWDFEGSVLSSCGAYHDPIGGGRANCQGVFSGIGWWKWMEVPWKDLSSMS
jgi:hypothetical protein